MSIRIASLSTQPDLAPLVARWRVRAFFDYPGGTTVEEMTALLLAPPAGTAETFVLFDGERPVATAGLTGNDLETRPDLTPWLAGVFVEPEYRGRSYATVLVRHVEAFAAAASIPVLWLYTSRAEGLYLRLGWQTVGLERQRDRDVVLMRRDLRQITPGSA
jgi:GNAT superfamily N-acetyltransferase